MTFKHITTVLLCLGLASANAQDGTVMKAEKSFEKYSYEEASEKLSSVQRKTTDTKRKLGLSHLRLREYKKAESYLADVANADDARPEDLLTYAEVLQRNRKYTEATDWMKRFNEADPSDGRGIDHVNSPDYINDLLIEQGQFTIKHLDINTAQQDFGPTFFGDKVVFASSRSKTGPVSRNWNWNKLPFLDLFEADKGTDGALSGLERFGKKTNKKYHDGPATFSADGTVMLFTRNNYESTDSQGVRRLELYECRYEDDKWSEPSAFTYNDKEYSVGHASLSADGKTLYFASDMPGGVGGVDIYRSTRLDDGSWAKAENLGSKINTEGDDLFPFIHPTGMLFFASNGQLGLGGLDILVADMSAGDRVGLVINPGAPLNGPSDDFALVLDTEMKQGYFSSDRKGGEGNDDIYSFDLLKPFVFGKRIEGIAMDTQGNILEETEIRFMDIDGNVLETVTTTEDGAYSFAADDATMYKLSGDKDEYFEGNASTDTKGDEMVVKADLILEKDPGISLFGLVSDAKDDSPLEGVSVTLLDNLGGPESDYVTDGEGSFRNPLAGKRINDRISYNLLLEKDGYLPKTVTYNKVLDREGQYDVHTEMDLSLTKLEVGMDIGEAIEINPIYFDVNKSDIRPDAELELQKIVEVMKQFPTMVIELGSHTDCRASEEYNRKLSDRRAKSSAAWIKERVADGERIYGKGYGESQLVNHCACGRTDPNNTICSEEEHQANRRTEFRIVKM